MPIPLPNLDDRSFDDLVAELVARIPAHTPEWTNPAPGDPGRTILELFAWLADTLLYRVNLVPARQKLAFLRLLDVRMRPALAARTLVTMSLEPVPSQPPRARLVKPLSVISGASPFETAAELTVLPIIGEAYRKRPLAAAELADNLVKLERLRALFGIDGASQLAPYVTTTVFAGGLPEQPDGFDLIGESVDHALWFALMAPEPLKAQMDAIRTVLGESESGAAQCLNLGVSPSLRVESFDADAGALPRRRFVVELTTPDNQAVRPNGVVYRELTVVEDRTEGLTRDGIIRVALPGKDSFFAPSNDVRKNLQAGSGDLPPRIDDPRKAERVLGWIRLRPTESLTSLGLAWAGINAVEADQRVTSTRMLVGQGNGQPSLELALAEGNIEDPTFSLLVEEPDGSFIPWKRTDDLALAAPLDRVFQLDSEAGSLRFGDGVRGRIPANGQRIVVGRMRVTRGQAGNIPAGTLSTLALSEGVPVKVHQPMAALGGADAETLDEAVARIPQAFRHRDRVVTASDYDTLARLTPGVRVGRVEVLPQFKPQDRRKGVPGVVTVLALPAQARIEAPYPRADRPFREAVHAFLDPRKPLGVELYVIGCEYVPVALTVGIDDPEAREQVHAAVKDALRRYLFALAPHGPQKAGWPLGRTIRRRELEVVVSRVEGVDGVSGPNLFVMEGGSWTRVLKPGGAETAEIPLESWQLPELVGVSVVNGEAPDKFEPPQLTALGGGFALPVVPEVC